jgi:hypothetical protein
MIPAPMTIRKRSREGLFRVDSCRLLATKRTTPYGAFRRLPSVPAKVGLLNPKPALDLGDGDCSSCPISAVHLRCQGPRDATEGTTAHGSDILV